jgi:hypothetical protein
VEQAQHRIALANRVDEEVGSKAKVARDRLQDAGAGAVEGGEQFEKGGAEALHFLGPHVARHHRLERMPRRQLAPDVPEFLEVEGGRALGGLDPKRRVAARAAAAER